MFDNKEITIDKVKDILYAVKSEFENEVDEIEDVFDKEISDESIDFAFELLERYIDKMENVLNDELEDFPQEYSNIPTEYQDDKLTYIFARYFMKYAIPNNAKYDFDKSVENAMEDLEWFDRVCYYAEQYLLEEKEEV